MVKFILNPKVFIEGNQIHIDGVETTLDVLDKIPNLSTLLYRSLLYCSPTTSVFLFRGNTLELLEQIFSKDFSFLESSLCIYIPANTTELNKTQDFYIVCNPTNIQLS